MVSSREGLNPKEGETGMNKTVEVIKWGKGWYVTKREGCNVQRVFCKTKTATNAQIKAWGGTQKV